MQFVGGSFFDRPLCLSRTRNRQLAVFLPVVLLFALIFSFQSMPIAQAAPVSVCGTAKSLNDLPATEINMVIDDSGSMFLSKTNEQIKLWSYAKYSLEVFAALMRPNDTLNVYLLSSYKKGGPPAKPVVTLSGADSKENRVAAIRDMSLIGKGTPFEPVKAAYEDLSKSPAQEKWLVVLTDGKFSSDTGLDTSKEISEYLDKGNSNPDSKLQIAFLSIGEEAATVSGLENDPRFVAARAATPEDLVRQMNLFANSIFRQRSALLDESGVLATDINMKKVDVFAQGSSVNVGPLVVDGSQIDSDTSVEVKWSDNPVIVRDQLPFEAIPETSLQGQLVTFNEVPKGQLRFDINGSSAEPVIFTTPEVGIGVDLIKDGAPVGGELTTGTYQVTPVVVDGECEPIASQELGNPESMEVTFLRDGQLVGTYAPGESVDLENGEYEIRMDGLFDQNLRVQSIANISVASSVSSSIKMQAAGDYKVSELAEFPPESEGTQFRYVVIEDNVERSFTQAEWDQIPPEEIKAVSTNSNIEFEAIKGEEVGQVTVVPRAPDGDVFAADTGTIEFEVFSEYTSENGISESTSALGTVEVIDDISAFDRFMNWWKTLGWKLLLLLLLIILILGYIFKKRFSKRVKKRPSISGTPNQVGTSSEESTGKFRKTGVRTYLPFVADTATMTYVPAGVSGFRPMKLKAGPGKSMIVTNWKQIAEKGNTEINGTPLDEETRRPPQFGPSATITATTPQMTYEMTPNS